MPPPVPPRPPSTLMVGQRGRRLGSATSSLNRGRYRRYSARERMNLSFVLVLFFLVVFACIVAFEVLFLDDQRDQLEPYDFESELQDSQLRIMRELLPQDSENGEVDQEEVAAAAVANGIHPPADQTKRPPPPQTVPSGSSSASPSSPMPGDWQPVTGTREKFYVYSAFYDGRRGRFIRIIAATKTRGSDKVLCKYWYSNGDPPVLVGATNKVIRENWNLKYSAHFVMCPLFLYNVGRTVNVPDEVSVLARPGDNPGNRLKVRNLRAAGAGAEPADAFAVCVKPLHYDFDRALQLIEFLELNRLFGVVHFTLYNHTVGPRVACVLRQYAEERVVTLLPWQLRMESQKEIRTEGLFAALNDCLYRNMYRYRYLLMIDLDEFIVPHKNDSLRSMVSLLTDRVDSRKVGSFSFMNSFFYLQWPNDTIPSAGTGIGSAAASSSSSSPSNPQPPPLVTLLKTRRRSKFHPHKQRSKCIVLPEHVIEMGNHFVWEFVPGKGAINVPPDVGFLHHYRVCEFGGDDCIKSQWVTDRTMFKFKDELVERVTQRLDDLKRTCGVTDFV